LLARIKQLHLYIMRKLRQRAQLAFALLLAVCLIAAEPLANMTQCQVYGAQLLRTQQAAAPKIAAISFSDIIITSASFASEILLAPVSPDCFQVFSDESLPTLVVLPIHDIILVVMPVLAGVVLFQRMYALPLPPLRSYDTSPPTPPPRHCAA
jgi:hypothetical protein